MTVRVSDRNSFAVSAETYWRDVWLNLSFLRQLYCEVLGFESVELMQGPAVRGRAERAAFTQRYLAENNLR